MVQLEYGEQRLMRSVNASNVEINRSPRQFMCQVLQLNPSICHRPAASRVIDCAVLVRRASLTAAAAAARLTVS